MNNAIPMIVVLQSSAENIYETHQRAIIIQGQINNDSKQTIIDRLGRVRLIWEPVWQAFRETRALNLKLKACLESKVFDPIEAGDLVTQLVQKQKQLAEVIDTLKDTRP